MQKHVFLITLLLPFIKTYSQASDTINDISTARIDKNVCLLTALNYSKNTSVDVGVSVNTMFREGIHPSTVTYFVANEFHFLQNPIIGPKIGAWLTIAYVLIGFNTIYYSDFNQNSFVLRPEIGFSWDNIKLAWGYNRKLTNKSFNRIAQNTCGFTYCFKLKKSKVKYLQNKK